MTTLRNDYPLNPVQRAAIAVTTIGRLGKTPVSSREVGTVPLSPETMRARKFKPPTWIVVASDPNDPDPLVEVTCDDGTKINVCPWCKANHPAEKLAATGLFFHGKDQRIFGCNRPVWEYSPAECDQDDYETGLNW